MSDNIERMTTFLYSKIIDLRIIVTTWKHENFCARSQFNLYPATFWRIDSNFAIPESAWAPWKAVGIN